MPVGKAYDPKFQDIIRFVQEKILSGEWPPGHKVPSIAQLRKVHGWNYSTLRGAILVLKARGLIEGKQGDGVFVTHPGNATEADMAWLERFLGGSLRRHTDAEATFVGKMEEALGKFPQMPGSVTLNGRTLHSDKPKGKSLGV